MRKTIFLPFLNTHVELISNFPLLEYVGIQKYEKETNQAHFLHSPHTIFQLWIVHKTQTKKKKPTFSNFPRKQKKKKKYKLLGLAHFFSIRVCLIHYIDFFILCRQLQVFCAHNPHFFKREKRKKKDSQKDAYD